MLFMLCIKTCVCFVVCNLLISDEHNFVLLYIVCYIFSFLRAGVLVLPSARIEISKHHQGKH